MEPIAVIGLAHRFPGGANTPARLWDVLTSGRDLSQEPDPSRLNLAKFHAASPNRHGNTSVAKAYFLSDDPSRFDAAFFGISPLEAEAMDPQQRLLLETVYEAGESAGLALSALRGSRCSVYVGAMTADYAELQLKDTEDLSTYTALGASRAVLANRVSHFFDLRGPSVSLDTACSSSLVALHLAVQDLRRRADGGGGGGGATSDVAVVAGVNLIFGPDVFITESKLQMLSPTGTSKMWDAGADGYARGEGVAALFLKPLGCALRDGDPIMGLIRGSGVNSDGRTPGITMPSATAQARLIQETYRAAGLEPYKLEDRCQYFEAHGTGTKAGDPAEARGIFESFFQQSPRYGQQPQQQNRPQPLLVGSIKTVIGHLEGCAGLAGVIKVLMAMQKGIIPANLHLNRLNPEIEPLSDLLRVPTKPEPWPRPPPGCPKRASVNSFGFGGTNGHVILESYEGEPPAGAACESERMHEPLTAPVVLSASSQTSLVKATERLAEYIRQRPGLSLRDLAWTLQRRRSELGVRRAFPAPTRQGLLTELDRAVEEARAAKQLAIGSPLRRLVSPAEGVGILGIFTGQGAQWPGMGRELLLHNAVFSKAVRLCEEALAGLADGPSWSLREELLKGATSSRVSSAEIAQPATTAIEIGLVDILRSHGVRFCAVVGHSSGEIAALYAAGVLRLVDAARIAYYRGKHAHLAGEGAMLAAGLSWDAGLELCRSDNSQFKGRLWPAARNSPSSITLSGDADAVQAAHKELQRRKIFSRLLRTDKAYHSPHMQACSDAYIESMRRIGIQPMRPSHDCVWVSSVYGNADLYWDAAPEELESSLAGQYWVENMVQPVLFADAVAAALTSGGPFDAVVEVGPHAALKSPVSQTLEPLLGHELPYCGTMARGENCIDAVAKAIGCLWTDFGSAGVPDFPDTESLSPPRVVTDLPAYAWDHDRSFWRESRISRNNRLRGSSSIALGPSLLGRRCLDDTDSEPRWRNFLSLEEFPWMRGHSFQGQALFPATGYVVIILEIAQALATEASRPRELALSPSRVEITNIIFERTLCVDDSKPIELITSVRLFNSNGNLEDTRRSISGSVSFHTCSDPKSGTTERTCFGNFRVSLMESGNKIGQVSLPPRVLPSAAKTPVDVEKFYAAIRATGLQYDGPFKRIDSLRRGASTSTATASLDSDEASWGNGLPHPGLLDTGLQPLFAAIAAPSTGRLWTPYLDHKFDKIVVDLQGILNPKGVFQQHIDGGVRLVIDAYVTGATATKVEGDISIYLPDPSNDQELMHPLVQIEGVALQALVKPDASSDRQLFSQTIWEPEIIGGGDLMTIDYSPPQNELVVVAERVSFYLLRVIINEADMVGIVDLKRHERLFVEHARRQLGQARDGEFPLYDSAWASDDRGTINELLARHAPHQVDFRLLQAVGDEIGAIFRGERQMLDVLLKDDMLGEFYRVGLGIRNAQRQVARYMQTITHRFPGADILEVGAGTGATTAAILEAVGGSWFGTYTFTDVSSGFFPKARQRLSESAIHLDMLHFCKLDITVPLNEQGFGGPKRYDVVVAANVLHIAPDVDAALRRVRQLLRPGGYLVAIEPTSRLVRLQVILGGVKGWWPSAEDADAPSRAGPVIMAAEEWDEKLLGNGFSGLDVFHLDQPDVRLHTCSSFVSQAVGDGTDRTSVLRDPLRNLRPLPTAPPLVVIGGATVASLRLTKGIEAQLSRFGHSSSMQIRDLRNLSETSASGTLPQGASVLCFAQLDQAASFKTGSAGFGEVLTGLQQLVAVAGRVLFVTHGAYSTDPNAAMVVGLLRGIRSEQRSLHLQILDIEAGNPGGGRFDVDASAILEHFIRFVLATQAVSSRGGGGEDDEMLWTTETELLLRGGRLFIPRLKSDVALNDRLNGQRRPIVRPVTRETHVIEIRPDGELAATPRISWSADSDTCEIQTVLSTVQPVIGTRPGQQPKYLCLGLEAAQGHENGDARRRVLAFSNTNASHVRIRQENVVEIRAEDMHTRMLDLTATAIACQAWVRAVARGSVVWVHGDGGFGADANAVVQLLRLEASKRRVRVCWTADKTTTPAANTACDLEKHDEPLRLHPDATVRTIKSLLPQRVAALIVGEDYGGGSFVDKMRVALGLEAELCGTLSAAPGRWSDDEEAARCLAHAARVVAADGSMAAIMAKTATTTLVEFSSPPADSAVLQPRVLDWTPNAAVAAHIQPLDNTGLFRPDMTYVMVGLTRELGLSICAWMIRQGAGHLLLASRDPKVDDEWLAAMSKTGAEVVVLSMDVGCWESVRTKLSGALASMPPVAGVCNGAMVLSDELFLRMDAATAAAAMRPKVDGSIHLDRYFSSRAAQRQLDFFILFSSIGSIIGIPGQSNYHMANLFMATLAANRRRRGLVGSVIDVGIMLDIGYILRQDTSVHRNMQTMGMMGMREEEAHLLFAEGIFAGHPTSSHPPEIVSGMGVSGDPADRPWWAADPRLSHFVRDRTKMPVGVAAADPSSAGTPAASALDHLRAALATDAPVDEAALAELIKVALSAKLGSLLQLPTGELDMSSALVGMGVDSLLAMEVRSWILKTVGVDVPVLQILGGITGDAICLSTARNVLSRRSGPSPVASAAPRQPLLAHVPARAPVSTTLQTHQEQDEREFIAITTPTPSLCMSEATAPTSQGSSSVISSPIEDTGKHTPSTPPSPHESDGARAVKFRKMLRADTPDQKLDVTAKPQPQCKGPLSFNQERLWFLQEFLQDANSYNEVVWYDIRGPLDADRLGRAFKQTTARHEILRTRLCSDPETGTPVQNVWSVSACQFRFIDSSHGDGLVMAEFDAMSNRKWDLEAGVCLGATLVRRSPLDHSFIMGAHHIAVDGLTWLVLLRDIARAYNSPSALATLSPPRRYLEFAEQQRSLAVANAFAPELHFWADELAGLPQQPLPLFPTMARLAERQATNRYRNATARRLLDSDTLSRIKQASCGLAVTPFHIHLTALRALIGRLSGASDFCIGVCDSGRTGHDDFSDTVGFFLNVVPVRLPALSGGATFGAHCRQASARAVAALAYSRVPLDIILDALSITRTTRHSPLFQVIINYRLGVLSQGPLGGECEVKYVRSRHSANPYDITLNITESPDGTCFVDLAAQEALYSHDAAVKMLDIYCHLLGSSIDGPHRLTADLVDEACAAGRCSNVIPSHFLPAARHSAPSDDVDRPRTEEWADTIPLQIRSAAEIFANDIAIKDGWGALTYSNLMRESDGISVALQHRFRLGADDGNSNGAGGVKGLSTGAFCLLFQPSAHYVTSLLAVLGIAAVAIPLDTRIHRERLAAMVKDCQPSAILHHGATADLAAWLANTCVDIPVATLDVSQLQNSDSKPADCILHRATASTPAAVLYTSGTTGVPKGAILTQGNYRSIISSIARVLDLGSRHSVLQQTSLGFDMSMLQILTALCTGARLVIATAEQRRDPEALASLAEDEGVTLIAATPTEFEMLLQHGRDALQRCTTLRTAVVGGEMFTHRLAAAFHKLEEARGGQTKRMRVFNIYGPTETCILSNAGLVAYWAVGQPGGNERRPADDAISVGPPLDGALVYIVGESGELLGVGSVGEVYIGGSGVGLGYLRRPELTSQAFTSDRFGPRTDEIRPTMYRTRDRGLLRPDGSLVILGRVSGDSQVKLRGIRIELEDISSAIIAAGEGRLSQAATTIRGDDKVIVAFATFARPTDAPRISSGNDDESFLASLPGSLPLPEYMRPAAIIQLCQLPTTHHGKLDTAALDRIPLPTYSHRAIDGTRPNNDHAPAEPPVNGTQPKHLSALELDLFATWQQALPDTARAARSDQTDANPESDFFRMGGNSVTLVVLRNKIRRRWGVELSLLGMFEASTLRLMAEGLREVKSSRVGAGVDWEYWDNETRFDPARHCDLSRLSTILGDNSHHAGGLNNGKTILITGGNTLLGSQVLRLILSRRDVAAVHCVAMSSEDAAQLSRAQNTDGPQIKKLVVHTGDLAAPNLGLSEAEVMALRNGIDAIVHAAGHGSCLNSYASIRDQNVGSTGFLAALGLAASHVRPVSFHFVSSARVILFSGKNEYPEASVAQFYPPAPVASRQEGPQAGRQSREGFTATKWASERLLESCVGDGGASQRARMEVTVHRTGYLLSESADEMDAINMLHRFADRLGLVPDMDGFSGFFDMCEVEWAAADIVDNIFSHTPQGPRQENGLDGVSDGGLGGWTAGTPGVRYKHHTRGDAVPVDRFQAYMEDRLGRPLRRLPMVEWAARAEEAGMSPFLASFLRAVCERGDGARYPKLLLGGGILKAK